MSLRNHNLWIARAKKPHKLARTCANLKIQKRCFRLRSVAKTDAEFGALTREASDVQIVSHCRGRLFLRPRENQKWWFRLRRVAKTRFCIRTEKAFLQLSKSDMHTKMMFSLEECRKNGFWTFVPGRPCHILFWPVFWHSSSKTQVFEITSTPVNLRPGCDFRALCEEGDRHQKHAFRSRSVAKTANAYFGPRVFRRSPPRYFCDTPHAKRSFLTKNGLWIHTETNIYHHLPLAILWHSSHENTIFKKRQ